MSLIANALAGAGSGVMWALAGYFKGVDPKGELPTVDYSKLGQTIIIGAIVGAVAGISGNPIDNVYAGMGAAGLIALIETSWKAVYRNILARIK